MNITKMIKENKKKPQSNINIKVDEDLYARLKLKLKKDGSSLHDFFMLVVTTYLREL